MTLAVAILGLALLAQSPGSTRAPGMSPKGLDEVVSVEAGGTCLDHATLIEDLRSWREDPQVDGRVAIFVRGSSTDPHALVFQLWLSDDLAVERSFDPAPAECSDLHAVVALAIAIALDDTLAEELGIVVPDVPPAQVVAGEGDLPQRDPAETNTDLGRPDLALTLAGGLFAGVSPRLSAGGLLSFDVRPLDHFDLRFGALATHHPSIPIDEGEVAVTVAAGRFDLCWGTSPMSVRLRLCGGAAGGATISAGRGFSETFVRTTPWFAAIAAVDVAVHVVGPLALELRVEGVFPFQRTRLDIRSPEGDLLDSELFPVAGLIVAVGPRFEF